MKLLEIPDKLIVAPRIDTPGCEFRTPAARVRFYINTKLLVLGRLALSLLGVIRSGSAKREVVL